MKVFERPARELVGCFASFISCQSVFMLMRIIGSAELMAFAKRLAKDCSKNEKALPIPQCLGKVKELMTQRQVDSFMN